MVNNIKNYFKNLQANSKKDPQHAITEGVKLGLIIVLTAGFYPIVHVGAASVVKTLSTILIPVLSLGTAASLGYIITDLAAPKIATLVEDLHAKFTTVSKNIPTTDEVKQAVYQTYDSIPPLATFKAMLFSAVTPAANASHEATTQNLTGLKKQKPN